MNDPAFCKRLLSRRWAGEVPKRVHVLFGASWEPPQGATHWLACSAKRFVPGDLDWRAVTDLRVEVVDRDDSGQLLDGWPLCVWLAAEIADHAGCVLIDTDKDLYQSYSLRLVDIQDIASEALQANGTEPSWWTWERPITHDQRRERFYAFERRQRGWSPIISAGVRR